MYDALSAGMVANAPAATALLKRLGPADRAALAAQFLRNAHVVSLSHAQHIPAQVSAGSGGGREDGFRNEADLEFDNAGCGC